MSNLKVLPLENWQQQDHEDLIEFNREVPDNFQLIGRDGYYCYYDTVWFEYNGRGYFAHSRMKNPKSHFVFDLKINDELILPEREAQAIRNVLKTSRDPKVKKVLWKRINRHDQAVSLRAVYRNACLFSMRWRNK